MKGQKMVQKWEKIVSVALYISEIINQMIFVCGMCKMIIFPGVFFIFSKFWFSGFLGGVKGQKIAQNDKKFCLLHSVSQEPYITWSSFVVRKCKMIISSVDFFSFSKLWFFGLLGRSKSKKWLKPTKTLSFALYISGTMYHMILIYGTHV